MFCFPGPSGFAYPVTIFSDTAGSFPGKLDWVVHNVCPGTSDISPLILESENSGHSFNNATDELTSHKLFQYVSMLTDS